MSNLLTHFCSKHKPVITNLYRLPQEPKKNNVPHVTCAGVFIKASGADGGRKNQKVIEGMKK